MAYNIQNIYDAIPAFIHELRNVVQSSYNMLSNNGFTEEDFLISQMLFNKLRSIKTINKEDITYISKNINGLYFAYTGESERKMLMRTPGIQAAWKTLFTTKLD